MSNIDLIKLAASVCNLRKVHKAQIGEVGCALETDTGKIFTGINIDVSSGMGFCAEHNAISTMLTAKEYTVTKIVAVAVDEQGEFAVLPRCGRCREFIKRATLSSLETEIILDIEKSVKLKDLLPFTDWWQPISIT